MPNPLLSQVNIPGLLADASVAYIQDANDFAGLKVAPFVGVDFQSGYIAKFAKDGFLRSQFAARAPCSESAGGEFSVDNTTLYTCQIEALHKDIDNNLMANAAEVYRRSLMVGASQWLTQQMLLAIEAKLAAHMATGKWTGAVDSSPSTKWDASGGTPISDIDDLKSSVKAATGIWPNTLVCGAKAHQVIRSNAQVLAFSQPTSSQRPSREKLAELFELENYIVAGSTAATSVEGATFASAFQCPEDSVLLCYVPKSPSILTPSALYTFAWTGRAGAGPQSQVLREFELAEKNCKRIEMEIAIDVKQVASDLGAYVYNVDT